MSELPLGNVLGPVAASVFIGRGRVASFTGRLVAWLVSRGPGAARAGLV